MIDQGALRFTPSQTNSVEHQLDLAGKHLATRQLTRENFFSQIQMVIAIALELEHWEWTNLVSKNSNLVSR